MSLSFRSSASFGKRAEKHMFAMMLKENLDIYLPLVDDDAIDAVIKRPDGKFVEVQIKARSSAVKFGNAALFAGLKHEQRPNYWFVFYSERMNEIWILSSKEFVKESNQNVSGKNAGKRSIHFNGKNSKEKTEHTLPQFEKYIVKDFQRIINDDPDN